MPRYSVLEIYLENCIDFNDKESMTKHILSHVCEIALSVQKYLENLDC